MTIQEDLPIGCLPDKREVLNLEQLSLEALWELRETAAFEIRDLAAMKAQYEMELARRMQQEHPSFEPDSGGTVQLAGERIIVTVGYDRTYAYDESKLLELQGELTTDEFGRLVKWEPKVNGSAFNQLLKRGGKVAELLRSARILKSARLTFEAKERV